jgi:hypothetical protein
MCGMCPDYVASCWVCTQPMRGNPDKTIGKQFFLEMGTNGRFCEHFIERYKTYSPCMYDHVNHDHCIDYDDEKEAWQYECDENCVENGWYTQDHLRAVVDAFNEWGDV